MSTYFLVQIKYRDPEIEAYKHMKAIDYPEFLEKYPEEALSKGLKVSEINVIRKFGSKQPKREDFRKIDNEIKKMNSEA